MNRGNVFEILCAWGNEAFRYSPFVFSEKEKGEGGVTSASAQVVITREKKNIKITNS